MPFLHTPGPWRVGRSGAVVSDHSIGALGGGHDETRYYGGHLIAESIYHVEDAYLIAASPEMQDALRQILSATKLDQVSDPEEFANGLYSARIALEKSEPPHSRDAATLRERLRALLAIVRTTAGDPLEADRILAAARQAAEGPP